MADSNPSIVSADIPTEAQPNNRFTFDVTIRQDGPDPWASEDNCISPNLDIKAWKTPVKLFVDGSEVDSETLCLASGNTKTAQLSASLSPGTHDLEVKVYQMGGNAYDLKKKPPSVNDNVGQRTEVTQDSSDPSRQSPTGQLGEWIASLAEAVGGTTQQVALGAALAIVLLLVI